MWLLQFQENTGPSLSNEFHSLILTITEKEEPCKKEYFLNGQLHLFHLIYLILDVILFTFKFQLLDYMTFGGFGDNGGTSNHMESTEMLINGQWETGTIQCRRQKCFDSLT